MMRQRQKQKRPPSSIILITILIIAVYIYTEEEGNTNFKTKTTRKNSIVTVSALTIAVFGGSGYVGRRVCKTLVESGLCEQVLSISRSGRPPSYYLNDGTITTNRRSTSSQTSTKNSFPWYDAVSWIPYEIKLNQNQNENELNQNQNNDAIVTNNFKIDAAISCIGNLQPNPQWKQLFGLSFDDVTLFEQNGLLNEQVIHLSKSWGAQRFVTISVNYESAKCLEGPIEGYMNGKRHAESIASQIFGEENTIVLGPSWIYGGNRFPIFGKWYTSFLQSFLVQQYLKTNHFLRNLSTAPTEDWVEQMVLNSPPVQVDVIARVIAASALGWIERTNVGHRRQGFYDTRGKPILYDNVLYIDGASNIERLDHTFNTRWNDNKKHPSNMNSFPTPNHDNNFENSRIHDDGDDDDDSYDNTLLVEPPQEGAFIGKGPYLFPLPVVATFLTIFYCIATNKFVQPIS